MTIALWITAILLTLVYLMAGITKTFQAKAVLQPKMGWVADFSDTQVKAVGIVEFIGALGVMLPLATGILPWLTPVAAICLVVVQIVAAVIHVRRGEKDSLPINAVLALLAAAVAVLYFLA